LLILPDANTNPGRNIKEINCSISRRHRKGAHSIRKEYFHHTGLCQAVMKKMIQAKCEQVPEQAFSFLSGYGNTMELWRSFLAHLNTALQPDGLPAAIIAANDCFTQFEKWIKEYYQAKTAV
jgi:hypothetical protein